MGKSRKHDKPSADEAKPRQPQPDDAPPKTIISRFARGLVLVEYVLLVSMGLFAVLCLVDVSIQSSGGATHSEQVKLAERQMEIEQALHERESAEQSFDHTADRQSDPLIARPASDLR